MDARGAPRIRSATVDDAARLVELIDGGALVAGREDLGDLAPYRAALAEVAASPRTTVLVAELDGEVVGMCQVYAFRHVQDHGGLCAEIESMHVLADHRAHGIGGRLLAAAEEFARGLGCYRIQLTSHRDRQDAHRFYARHGYDPSHLGFKKRL